MINHKNIKVPIGVIEHGMFLGKLWGNMDMKPLPEDKYTHQRRLTTGVKNRKVVTEIFYNELPHESSPSPWRITITRDCTQISYLRLKELDADSDAMMFITIWGYIHKKILNTKATKDHYLQLSWADERAVDVLEKFGISTKNVIKFVTNVLEEYPTDINRKRIENFIKLYYTPT